MVCGIRRAINEIERTHQMSTWIKSRVSGLSGKWDQSVATCGYLRSPPAVEWVNVDAGSYLALLVGEHDGTKNFLALLLLPPGVKAVRAKSGMGLGSDGPEDIAGVVLGRDACIEGDGSWESIREPYRNAIATIDTHLGL